MNYNQILLCYFQQKPFASLARKADLKYKVFTLQMLQTFMEGYIADLQSCILPLIAAGEDRRQSFVGFEMGLAQIVLDQVHAEYQELITVEVLAV